jgi:glucose/arabinose dehydrogenase/mono/diheme cytochrome c family protein
MKKIISSTLVVLVVIGAAALILSAQKRPKSTAATSKSQACANDDSGLTLPAGFCATVFADGIGHARHMVAAPNGVLYVNTWSGRYYGNDTPPAGGFLVALQDKRVAGKADVVQRFGETVQSGGRGGTGIGMYKGAIYAEINDRIVRYALPSDSIVPRGAAETIVSGLPLGGDHPMHPFLIASDGTMYVDVASATNSCQQKNRSPKSPGLNPCAELETRAGVWRYDANKTNQTFSPAERFATGIRNAEGFALDPSGRLFVTNHGRDQLYANWQALYKPAEEATEPAEELLLLKSNADYGWPECYYDGVQQKRVLAPEYGGDGGKAVGACGNKVAPAAAFPPHWAPNAMVRYDKEQFPAHYRNGVFVAFHGSWDRAPYAQGGYNVVFQPLDGERASGECEIFADGFAGRVKSPSDAKYRPSGLAVGQDGALYVSDDVHGRIYRIAYRGGADFNASSVTKCPSAAETSASLVKTSAEPPEGTNPNAGAAAVAVPPGATQQTVQAGARVYRGSTCSGCHGDRGQGTPLGPALNTSKWLWGDGSLASIKKLIADGVPQPKQYRSPMPPMGGAQLTPKQLSAVSAYVWSLSHASTSSRGKSPKGK